MSSLTTKLALGAALLVSTAFGATAADLGGDSRGSLKDSYSAPASPARWYFRLDGGYAMHDAPDLRETGVFGITETHHENTWTLGGGLGLYLSRNVRADITYDHRFASDISGFDRNGGSKYSSTFPGKYHFGMKSDVVLANIYYDFIGIHDHLKPYVGVGLGFTRNTTTDGAIDDIGLANNCPCGGPASFTASIPGASQTHVAAAFMTGTALKLRENLSVDAGYRLLYLGDAHTGDVNGSFIDTTTSTSYAAQGNDPVVRGIIGHEFRVGLRYDMH